MGKQQSKQLKPVERNADGSVKAGTPNPGGLTKEQHAARNALNRWLCEAPQVQKGKEAYVRLLEADNPVIAKDFMDRVAGKVKESLEVSGDPDSPIAALAGLTAAQLLAIARGEKPE